MDWAIAIPDFINGQVKDVHIPKTKLLETNISCKCVHLFHLFVVDPHCCVTDEHYFGNEAYIGIIYAQVCVLSNDATMLCTIYQLICLQCAIVLQIPAWDTTKRRHIIARTARCDVPVEVFRDGVSFGPSVEVEEDVAEAKCEYFHEQHSELDIKQLRNLARSMKVASKGLTKDELIKQIEKGVDKRMREMMGLDDEEDDENEGGDGDDKKGNI